MSAIDTVNRIFREFKRYTGDGLPNEPTNALLPIGDPQSGVHNPKKSEIRAGLLSPIEEAEGFANEAREWAEAAEEIAVPAGSIDAAKITDDPVEQSEIRDKLGLDSGGFAGGIPSRAWAIADYHPQTAPDSLRTDGYYAAGDGGGALYKKAVSEPSHAGKLSITLASGGGTVWYEIAEKVANILAFGARHTEANNAPMIQAAIDWACNAIKGAVVLFPAPPTGQTYNITQKIIITKMVAIKGESIDVQIYANMPVGSTPIFDVNGTVAPNLEQVSFQTITLRSNTTTRANGIEFTNAAYINMRDVRLFDLASGIVLSGSRSFSNKFENVQVFPKASGIAARFVGFTGGGHHHFVDCTFCAETGFKLEADSDIAGLVFTSCNFEQCTDALQMLGTAYGTSFNGCYSEKNGSNYTFSFTPAAGKIQAGLTISGGFFETDGEAYVVLLGGAGKVEGFNFCGNYARDYATAFVRYNSAGVVGGEITGNYITDIPELTSNGPAASVRIANNRYSGGDRN